MSPPSTGRVHRRLALIAGIATALFGAAMLVEPFLSGGAAWHWSLGAEADLDGAEVNARRTALDADGILLSRDSQRPMSLISPPLSLPHNAGRVFVLRASMIRVTLDAAEQTPIRLLWQTEPGQAFHYVEQSALLTGEPTDIAFSLPAAPEKIHRIGVQFPALEGPIRIASLSLPRLSMPARLGAFARQAVEPEPLANHSVNFLRGPIMLGRPANWYLAGLSLLAVGVCVAGFALNGDLLPSGRCIVGVLVVVWLLGDALFTQGLARGVLREVRSFHGKSPMDRAALADGAAVAWCAEAVIAHVPSGATYCLVSGDSFYPARRVDYLLAPYRVRVEQSVRAEYLIVFNAPDVVLDEAEGLLRQGDEPALPVRLLGAGKGGVRVYRNLAASPVEGAGAVGSFTVARPEGRGSSGEKGAQPSSAMLSGMAWSTLAILIPWTAGCLIVASLLGSAARLVVLSTGYLVGQALVMFALYIDLRWLGGAHPRYILALIAVTCIVLWCRRRRRFETSPCDADALFAIPSTPTHGAPTLRSRGPRQTFLLAVIAALLAAKVAAMLAAVAFVPIRGDDAITVWLYRAKVITALGAMPLDPSHPYYLGGFIPSYPVPCSLMAAWVPLVTGGWHEGLAVIAWPLLYLNLLTLIVGGLRRWLDWPAALVAAYLVGSLPLLAVHVIRPGYADLPLAVYLAGSVLYLLTWRETGSTAAFALGLLLAATAACLKREGLPVALLCVLVMPATSASTWRAASSQARGIMVGMFLVASALCLGVQELSEPVSSLLPVGWQTGVPAALARHAFSFGSFSILGWGVVAAVFAVAAAGRTIHRSTALVLPAALFAFVAAIFLLTPQGRFALNDQTPSRLLLQVVPAVVVLLAVSLSPLLGRFKTAGDLE